MAFWEKSDIRNWLPQLQCHRGYWIEGLQQNSLQSVQQAFLKGYEITEFDVRMTADEVVVLFHDEKYQNQILEKTNFTDFKERIQPEFSELSRFEDVLNWMRGQIDLNSEFDFKLNIEIKSRKIIDGRLEEKVCQLLRKFSLQDRVLISSFNPMVLLRVRKCFPSLRRALLVTHDQESNWILNMMFLNYLAKPHVLHLRWKDLNKTVLGQVGGKVPIVLWTVNDPEWILKNRGHFFGVISDQITPEEFRKIKSFNQPLF